MASRLVGIVAVAAALVFGGGTPVGAQMWMEPAGAERAVAGPAVARGVVVWSHGRSVWSEDSEAPSPLYLTTFREAGFDVLRFNRMRRSDTLEASAAQLAREAQDLRQRGYRRVVLAGQSFGGFLSLMAAGRTDAIDAVIATAPAAYGSFTESPDTWRLNAEAFYPLLKQVRSARVFLAFFHGDGFDPGGRGERSQEILRTRGLPHLVVDQPVDLVGHAASANGLFVRRFGDCLLRFADAPPSAGDPTCESGWGRRTRAVQASSVARGGLAAHVGRWVGFYANGRDLDLTVDPGEGGRVTMTYRLGAGVEPGHPPETVRRDGRLDGDALVFDEPGRNLLRLAPRPDGRLSLLWTAREGGARLDATLVRTAPGDRFADASLNER
jgi:pimeloyl-ACP methyl ester carboxylesterase